MNIKKTIINLITLILIQFCYSQESGFTYKTKNIIETRDLYINGGARSHFGGKSRVYIKIDLPKNTDHWYYSFSTSAGKGGTKNLNLAIQLAGLLADPSGFSSNILTAIKIPQGSASVDVYLLDNFNKNAFINKTRYQYYTEGMVENTKQAAVRIDDVKTGTYYLGIKNPSTLNGLNISIEVVAIVKTEIVKKKNIKQEKAELYGKLGWSKFLKGEYQKCIQYCNKSNELFPLAWVQANKGLATLILGKEIEATDIYINALLIAKKQPKKEKILSEILENIYNLIELNPNINGANEIIELVKHQKIN
ncbi:hypothetical protein [uncultured Tenacibaculum sp.]|uniref:hypothetical protein n=1 Tax=uncultured Tenacibaculum sp. TaxID=174713 RepID=UPI00260428A9|nr:hypothetical protein [uncultured Tenacibaculum sp.]